MVLCHRLCPGSSRFVRCNRFNLSVVRILLACSHTSVLRKCLLDNGHYVLTCDLKKADHPGEHYTGDIFDVVPRSWDMMIAFPPCTYLARVQAWRCNRSPSRAQMRDNAVQFVKRLSAAEIPRIAIENPIGYLSQVWKQPTQIVRPWWFGDPYRKEICLWLKGVPGLLATLYNPVRRSISNHVNGRMSQDQKSEIKSSWDWYPGMCQALADQWAPKTRL